MKEETFNLAILAPLTLAALLHSCYCGPSCSVTPEPVVCTPSGSVEYHAVTRQIVALNGPITFADRGGNEIEVPAGERWYPDPTMPDGWRREPKRMRVAEGFKP